MNQFLQAPEYTIRAISNFFANSLRYSQLKVHHRVVDTGGKKKWKKSSVREVLINFLTPWRLSTASVLAWVLILRGILYINLAKSTSLLFHAIHSLFYWRNVQKTITRLLFFKILTKKSSKQENSSLFMISIL